jgi:antitoxin (DNA-binding transcriptional repressor) of toxin-antitoxin stability system
MRIIEKADATATLAEYTAEIQGGPVIVTSEGRPVAALVAIENADLKTVSLSTNPKFIEMIQRSRARAQAESGIPSEEMRARFE